METLIRSTKTEDLSKLFKIFSDVNATGDCYPYSNEVSEEQFKALWMAPSNVSYVAEIDGAVAGAYFIKAQWPDRGSHVATAHYMVSKDFRRMGVGRLLGEHSLKTARDGGFLSMQFNLVVSTNESAIKLYEKLGFKIIGRLPKTFNHSTLGLVDTFVMHRFL